VRLSPALREVARRSHSVVAMYAVGRVCFGSGGGGGGGGGGGVGVWVGGGGGGGGGVKVPCVPKKFDSEFPIIKTTKLLVETRSCT